MRSVKKPVSVASDRDSLRSALAPFVEALAEWGDDERTPDSATLWDHPLSMCVTVGHFRRAATALAVAENACPLCGAKSPLHTLACSTQVDALWRRA